MNCRSHSGISFPDPSLAVGVAHANSRRVGPSSDDDVILTVKDVAGILKVPVSWIYDRSRPGRADSLPAFKVGKYLRFSLADIRSYIMSQRSRAIISVEIP